jgi:enoyl-CoA hydratase/carnithine racemase
LPQNLRRRKVLLTIERTFKKELDIMLAENLKSTGDQPVLLDVDERVAKLTLNRPDKYNTLTESVIQIITDNLNDIAQREDIHVVIIKSIGKAFSTGHDLKDMHANNDENYFRMLLTNCSKMMLRINTIPQPVIAQVQGIATAAGCQLVAACDLAVASRNAQFATNGISNGLYCATPAVALSRVVSKKHALEMLLTGSFISAQRAAEIGLINSVVAEELLDSETSALAEKIAGKSSFTSRLGKRSFYEQIGKNLPDAYEQTSEDLVCNLLSTDGQEGLSAFLEKRPPKWDNK